MISPRIAKNNKLVIIYDAPQHQSWISAGKAGKEGVEKLLQGLLNLKVSFDDVSMLCLSDSFDGKATGYKEKAEKVEEFITSYNPNMLLFATAKTFELCMGMKGASKYYGKIIECAKYGNIKAMAIPPYSMIKHNPAIEETINRCLYAIKQEMETSEITKVEQAEKHYTLITTIEQFREFYQYYKKEVFRYAVDIETNSLQFNNGKILTIQFSHRQHYGYCIPTPNYHGTWTEDEWAEIVAGIKDLIEDDAKRKVGANIYFDLKFLNFEYGIKLVRKNVQDVLIQSFLCDENRESHSLKFCAATLLKGYEGYDDPLEKWKADYAKANKIKKSEVTYDLIPLDILWPYGCLDVDASVSLADYFDVEIVNEQQEKVYEEVVSYAWSLARIEQSGWKIDLKEAERYRKELEERIEALEIELQSLPEIKKAILGLSAIKLKKENEKRKNKLEALKKPLTFLVNSPAHKVYLFKDVLGFAEVKKTKKGKYGTDKECFAVWAEKYPHVQSIKTIKEIEGHKKMLSTYVMALINRNVNGRIHCSFKVCGAATGRISCVRPNLMNIAQHSEEAAKLKKCFIAEEGHSIVLADLSNAELRVTAALSKDPVMTLGFQKGLDPHSNTAKEVFNLDCEVSEVKEKHNDKRQASKVLSFAAIYGAAAPLIAKNIGCSVKEAAQYLEEYFVKHRGVRKFLNEVSLFAEANGFVWSVAGRKRRVPHVFSEDENLKNRALRQACNYVVQSITSDLMQESLVSMWEEIDEKQLPYKIINTIHDSAEMEVPDECLQEACEFVIRHLSHWPKCMPEQDFPMLSDAEYGKNWSELTKADFSALEYIEDEDTEEDDQDEEEQEAA